MICDGMMTYMHEQDYRVGNDVTIVTRLSVKVLTSSVAVITVVTSSVRIWRIRNKNTLRQGLVIC